MISLPANFIANILSTSSGIIGDVMPLVLLFGGVMLAGFILENIFNN